MQDELDRLLVATSPHYLPAAFRPKPYRPIYIGDAEKALVNDLIECPDMDWEFFQMMAEGRGIYDNIDFFWNAGHAMLVSGEALKAPTAEEWAFQEEMRQISEEAAIASCIERCRELAPAFATLRFDIAAELYRKRPLLERWIAITSALTPEQLVYIRKEADRKDKEQMAAWAYADQMDALRGR
jgi:hypothetical protein